MNISTPLTDDVIEQLHSGDRVTITGTIYVGRDAAHMRLVAALDAGDPLPFDPSGQVIYYMGPAPAKPGDPIGSAGPTTSYRMDPYAPRLMEVGLKGMIGKGNRSPAVREAMQKHKAVYFGAIGGAGALIAKSVRAAEVIAAWRSRTSLPLWSTTSTAVMRTRKERRSTGRSSSRQAGGAVRRHS